MPRPLRIEYQNAIYHVMNRGRGRQFIFHSDRYYQVFLEILEQAHQRFGCVIHAYCLMGNHYHLLIETPLANLSRVMRHINGVYTQSYNRLYDTDGPLFRGRYKAILVSHDEYFLQVSRYIHRNPIEVKTPLVEELKDYRWSSYPIYVCNLQHESWLNLSLTLQLIGSNNAAQNYQVFVMRGSDEETISFHKKGQSGAVFGSNLFKEWIFDELLPELEVESKTKVVQSGISLARIVKHVCRFYQVTIEQVTKSKRGLQHENEPRKVAMYLCQELTGATLQQLMTFFNLSNISSVSSITTKIRKQKRLDRELAVRIDGITKVLAVQE